MPQFWIKFDGQMASGKTVALRKVKTLLEQEGYTVTQTRDGELGFDHVLEVSWKK